MSKEEKELNEKFAKELSETNDIEKKLILAFKHGLELSKVIVNKELAS